MATTSHRPSVGELTQPHPPTAPTHPYPCLPYSPRTKAVNLDCRSPPVLCGPPNAARISSLSSLFWPFGMPPSSPAHFLLDSYINKWDTFPVEKCARVLSCASSPYNPKSIFSGDFLCPKIHPGTARPCVASPLPMVTAARSRSLPATWAFAISTPRNLRIPRAPKSLPAIR